MFLYELLVKFSYLYLNINNYSHKNLPKYRLYLLKYQLQIKFFDI